MNLTDTAGEVLQDIRRRAAVGEYAPSTLQVADFPASGRFWLC